MRLLFVVMCLMMVLMVGCPTSTVSTDEDSMNTDCRLSTYQCAPGFTCEANLAGEFTCVSDPIAGGGQGDDSNRTCAIDNGGCGDPSSYLCVDSEGATPVCRPITNTKAPPVLGAFVDALIYQGENKIESCHVIYMPSARALTDDFNDCESCAYAWLITYDKVYSSCEIEHVQSFEMPVAVDQQLGQLLFYDNQNWGYTEDPNVGVAVNDKFAVYASYERDPYGPTSGQVGDVYSNIRFLEFTWENESATCGDYYCDYGDFTCSSDCLVDQNPATAYRFRGFGFSPESSDYQHCFSVAALQARREESFGACENCTESWYFQTKTLLSNCGSWSNPIGTTNRSDLGVRDGNQLLHAYPGIEGWFNLTEQYSRYHQRYNALLGSFDSSDFEDINLNAQQDANEPDRSRTQVMVIHYQ